MNEPYYIHIYLWSEDEGKTPLEIGLSSGELNEMEDYLNNDYHFIKIGNTYYSTEDIKKVTIL
jgi:hypothetical protein